MAKVGGHILHMSKICSSELTKKISCESIENHLQKKDKNWHLTYFGLIQDKKGPKNIVHWDPYSTHF